MFNTKLLLVLTLLLVIKQTLSLTDICDPASDLQNFVDRFSSNTKIDTNENHVRFILANSTSVEECIQECCRSIDCNLAFFKDLQACFLVTCKSDKYCTPIENEKKSNTDPIDYMIRIRSATEELASSPEEKQILMKQETECRMNSSSSDTGCLLNEICLMGKCKCPEEFSYYRIDGQCREYLKKGLGCSMFMDECNHDLNEECVTHNSIARHGTCQCKLGFKRNSHTKMCEIFTLKYDNQQASSKRKRPDLNNNDENLNDEYTLDGILKELGLEKNDILSDQSTTSIINQNVSMPTTTPLNKNLPTISTTTLSTPTTTEEPITEPAKIDTKDLKAFAGNDIHVYYPTTTVVLDGSLTRYYGSDGIDGITGWLWIKHESSPAFGKFYQTNDKPRVIFEQMVEGTYKFILKVWSKTGEFSQDTINVHVHSYMNSSELYNKNNKSMIENQYINENIIQIEIDTEPKQFTEAFKANFLNKLNILLQQSKLQNPRVVLVKTDISLKLKKSRVILDILVCENVEEINETKLNQDLFSFDYLVKIAQDNHFSPDSGTKMRRVLNNNELISLLKRNHKIYTFKNSFGSYLMNTNNDFITDYLGLKITEIGQLACDLNNKSSNFNCSNHGYCDSITHKCVCNKYWMPNLFRFYFQNENDLTNGNNCEWNLPVFITLMSILGVFLTIITGTVMRKLIYYFCYIFCCICCCCCRRKKQNSNKYDDFKKNKMKKYSKLDLYLEEKFNRDQMEDSDSDNEEMQQKLLKYKKSALNKLKSKFKSVPSLGNKNLHKYALLNEEDEIKSNSKNDRMGAKLNLNQSESVLNVGESEEDVVFEQSYSISPEKLTTDNSKMAKKSKKKSNEFVKEYKEIV